MDKSLQTLLHDMGVLILVVCPEYKPTPFEIHELTAACNPIKVVSINISIESDDNE